MRNGRWLTRAYPLAAVALAAVGLYCVDVRAAIGQTYKPEEIEPQSRAFYRTSYATQTSAATCRAKAVSGRGRSRSGTYAR
jgi:hypothetical protein